MSKYIPSINHLCYIRVLPRERTIEVDNGFGLPTQQVILEHDNSFSNRVFRCVGFDDSVVVCKSVYGGFCDDPQIFRRDLYQFLPVGPLVAKALGITTDEDA